MFMMSPSFLGLGENDPVISLEDLAIAIGTRGRVAFQAVA
jgi:hypothetical protein